MLRAVVLTQYRRVTGGQTDRQTDGIAVASTTLAMRALRRAVKSDGVMQFISDTCSEQLESDRSSELSLFEDSSEECSTPTSRQNTVAVET